MAADMLVRRISGEPVENMDVVMPSKLIIKASSGPAPSGTNFERNGK
jgi:DNA-binding LacI/PurR family transcriptional regulator